MPSLATVTSMAPSGDSTTTRRLAELRAAWEAVTEEQLEARRAWARRRAAIAQELLAMDGVTAAEAAKAIGVTRGRLFAVARQRTD